MKNSKKAFTIIELMSVIVIIGILSSLAIPSFLAVKARTQQEKMKNTLRLIAQYEEVFFVEHDYYAPGEPGVSSYTFEIFHNGSMSPEGVNLSELPFVFPANRNYDYRIYWVNNGEEHYFYAHGIASIGRGNDIDGDAKMDEWQVSSYDLELVALSNDLGSAVAGGGDSDGEGSDDGDSDGKGKGKGKGKDKDKDKGKEKEEEKGKAKGKTK